MKTMNANYLVITVILGVLIIKVSTIKCYDCRSDNSPCDAGECTGEICVRMETTNLDNEQRRVYKSCSDEYEEIQCKKTTFGNKLINRCTCGSGAFCNGELYEARLTSNASINFSGSLLLTFVFLAIFF